MTRLLSLEMKKKWKEIPQKSRDAEKKQTKREDENEVGYDGHDDCYGVAVGYGIVAVDDSGLQMFDWDLFVVIGKRKTTTR